MGPWEHGAIGPWDHKDPWDIDIGPIRAHGLRDRDQGPRPGTRARDQGQGPRPRDQGQGPGTRVRGVGLFASGLFVC